MERLLGNTGKPEDEESESEIIQDNLEIGDKIDGSKGAEHIEQKYSENLEKRFS